MPPLRPLVLRALQAATPSVEALAVRLGCSTSALRRYRQGNRTPAVETVRRIALELRRQAAELVRIAEQLERRNDA